MRVWCILKRSEYPKDNCIPDSYFKKVSAGQNDSQDSNSNKINTLTENTKQNCSNVLRGIRLTNMNRILFKTLNANSILGNCAANCLISGNVDVVVFTHAIN